jgi:hypothetical protein
MRAGALALTCALLRNAVQASAPPANVTIDYTVGALSKSRYLRNLDSKSVHIAALNGDFPDPTAIQSGNMTWAFATGARAINIQIASKTGVGPWNLLGGEDALPRLPRWVDAKDPQVWAPSVTRIVSRVSTPKCFTADDWLRIRILTFCTTLRTKSTVGQGISTALA